jgi:Sel1 repeat
VITAEQRAAYIAMTSADLESLAATGDAEAQYQLGLRHHTGEGAAQDPKEAFALWRSAAEQGHLFAQNNLAFLYQSGTGTRQDEKLAYRWYLKAAQQGYAIAQVNVGKMLAHGLGVKADSKAARAWFEKSAAQGNTEAQELLEAPEYDVAWKNWALLFILLGIIPWAMFYTAILAPRIHGFLGLDRLSKLPIGLYVVPILALPCVLLALVYRTKKRD